MPILRPAFRALLFVAALIAGQTATGAMAETATFDFYVSGIKAGTATLATEQSGGGYSAKSRIDAAGMLGVFVSFFYDGQASGRVDAKGTVVPAKFEATSKSPRGERRTEIDWKNGTPIAVSVEPPRSTAPDPALQGGTLDPISAGFAVLRDAPPDQICDKTVNVFDGSRLSRLRLDAPAAKDGGYVCSGAYSRIEGEAHTLSSQREFPFQLIFITDSAGLARLDRIETRTNFGLAVLERRS